MSFSAKTVSACIVVMSAMPAVQPASARSAEMTSLLTVVAKDVAGLHIARNNNFSNRSQKTQTTKRRRGSLSQKGDVIAAAATGQIGTIC